MHRLAAIGVDRPRDRQTYFGPLPPGGTLLDPENYLPEGRRIWYPAVLSATLLSLGLALHLLARRGIQ